MKRSCDATSEQCGQAVGLEVGLEVEGSLGRECRSERECEGPNGCCRSS